MRVGIARRRCLHRHRPDDLHEVVDDDVAERADRVVEVPAVLDAEALGHRDLDARDVVAVPDRLEDRVREAQEQELREAELPEVVVDPVELALVEVLVHLLRERARGREVVAERLLDDDARVLGEADARQPLDHGAEQERRDLEVEDRDCGRPSGASPGARTSRGPRSRRRGRRGGPRSGRRPPGRAARPRPRSPRGRARAGRRPSSRRPRRRRSGRSAARAPPVGRASGGSSASPGLR